MKLADITTTSALLMELVKAGYSLQQSHPPAEGEEGAPYWMAQVFGKSDEYSTIWICPNHKHQSELALFCVAEKSNIKGWFIYESYSKTRSAVLNPENINLEEVGRTLEAKRNCAFDRKFYD